MLEATWLDEEGMLEAARLDDGEVLEAPAALEAGEEDIIMLEDVELPIIIADDDDDAEGFMMLIRTAESNSESDFIVSNVDFR